MIKFAVSRNSWHYAYYQWIREKYGATTEHEPTSLCPYCQTMLWGSVVAFISLPSMILGMLYLRFARYACKWELKFFDNIIDWFEQKTRFMELLDEGPSSFDKSPILTGWVFTFLGLVSLIAVAVAIGAVGAVLWVFGYGVFNIGTVLEAIGMFFATLGWGAFHVFYGIGFGLTVIWAGLVWLFTNGELWRLIGSWVLYILYWIVGVGVGCVALGICCMLLLKVPGVRRVVKGIATFLNGFPEARQARRNRIRAKWECPYCNYTNNGATDFCYNCSRNRPVPPREPTILGTIFGSLFGWIAVPFVWCNDTYIKVRDKRLIVLSSSSLFWQFLLSIKKGVCPAVEFFDPAELQAQAQAAAAERQELDDKADALKNKSKTE